MSLHVETIYLKRKGGLVWRELGLMAMVSFLAVAELLLDQMMPRGIPGA
jgi:hypothetical protein